MAEATHKPPCIWARSIIMLLCMVGAIAGCLIPMGVGYMSGIGSLAHENHEDVQKNKAEITRTQDTQDLKDRAILARLDSIAQRVEEVYRLQVISKASRDKLAVPDEQQKGWRQ